jgi:predicted phage tail protein
MRISVGVTSLAFTDKPLVNDQDYSYTIRGVDASGTTRVTYGPLTVHPYDDAPPAIPSPRVAALDSKLSISWGASTDSTGVACYRLYRAVGAAPFGAPLEFSPTTFTYLDDGLINGQSYRYAMRATDVYGQSSPLSTVRVAAPKDLTGPAAVGMTAQTGDGSAALSWDQATDPSGIAHYRIFRAVGAGSYVLAASVPAAASRTLTQSGLMAGTEYRYVVRAVDTKGNLGQASATVTVTPPSTGLAVTRITFSKGLSSTQAVPVTVAVELRSDSASAVLVPDAKVTAQVLTGTTTAATITATSARTGVATMRFSATRGKTYRLNITGIIVGGRTWDGTTPDNSVVVE